MRYAAAIVVAFLVAGCGSGTTTATSEEVEPATPDGNTIEQIEAPKFSARGEGILVAQDYEESGENDVLASAGDTEDRRDPFDEDEARQRAEDDLRGETYRSVGRPYGCTEDCLGHEAGFQYRANDRYGGRIAGDYDSRSFRQGQQAYDDEVDRRVEEAQEAYEAGEDY